MVKTAEFNKETCSESSAACRRRAGMGLRAKSVAPLQAQDLLDVVADVDVQLGGCG